MLPALLFSLAVARRKKQTSLDLLDAGWLTDWLDGLFRGAQPQDADTNGKVSAYKYFFHVHKCGGSSVCKLAEAHGEKVNFMNNCNGNPQLAFDCNHDKRSLAEQSADDQLASLRAANYTFVANECTTPHEMVNHSSVLYAISLREPLERAASNFRYAARWNYTDFGTNDFDTFILEGLNRSTTNRTGPVANSKGWKESTFSDYETRYLSGKLEVGPVTDDHLKAAKAALRRMDVLIDMDYPQESMQLLGKTFGWEQDLKLPAENSLGGDSDDDDVLSVSDEAYAKLMALNAKDIELYEYMQQLAAGQRARLHQGGGRAHSASAQGWVSSSSKGAEALLWKRRLYGDAVKLHRRIRDI